MLNRAVPRPTSGAIESWMDRAFLFPFTAPLVGRGTATRRGVVVGSFSRPEIRDIVAGMKLKYEQAKVMRRNLTQGEFVLWDVLRHSEPGDPIFRRQYPFGPYILDFYRIRAKLAVEVDGQVHDQEEQALKDERRDAWLATHGVYTYRVSARDIFRDVAEVGDGIYALAMDRSAER